MDTVRYLMYRRAGGTDGLLSWEFAPVESWNQAPEPGQVAKRLVEGLTQRPIGDRWAWLTSTLAHWCYGSAWGIGYGILAGSLRQSRAWYGLPFGATVWASGYAVLPEAGLYKPIWEYDRATLARDLTSHLAYGASTGAAFCAVARI
jgi:ABC-type nitrate/sulfonate/bicarbonate transport system permease component